jgi:hypothetical protein
MMTLTNFGSSMMPVYWEVLPGTDLAIMENWRKVAKDRYFTLRIQVVIVKRELDEHRDGTVIASHPVSKDTIEIGVKRQLITSRTDTIQAALRYNTTERILDQLSAKISSELAVKAPGFSGKLGSSVMSKEEYELTKTTETSLGSTTSFFMQESTEKEHRITLNPGEAERTANLRIRYMRRRWDVYLYCYEALELTYDREIPFVWNRVRKIMKTAETDIVGWPLVSILYWEPQTDQVITYDPVPDPLEFPEAIEVAQLIDPMPAFRPEPMKSLAQLAQIAFPSSKEEKVLAKRHKRSFVTVKKAPAKKAVASRSFAKKASVRASTSRKAVVKKTVIKKTALKNSVAKRVVSKKAVSKKSARR